MILKYSLIALLLINMWSCKNKEVTQEEQVEAPVTEEVVLTDKQMETFELTEATLEQQIVSNRLTVNGQIELPPQNIVSVSAALGGFLKDTKLVPGMSFRKGELIALLEDNQFIQLQQDYLTTSAQLQNAEATYTRQKELNANKASSDKALLQSQADYQTLLISQKALAFKLQLIHIDPQSITLNTIRKTAPIYAPFDGVVAKMFVNLGKYVTPSDVLFELMNPKDVYLAVKVFEKDWDRVQVGQVVEAFSNSDPDKRYAGKVIRLGKAINDDRSLEAFVQLDRVGATIIPGMYMNAEIRIPADKAWGLPEESVLNYEGKSYVFEVLGANKFKLLPVQLGKQGSHWVAITNADSLHGKKFVQKGAYTLLMALKNKGED